MGKDCALALLGVVLGFSSSTRSYTPCHDAEVPQVVHGSSVAGVEKTVESTRGEDGQDPTVAGLWWRSAWIRLSCPLL